MKPDMAESAFLGECVAFDALLARLAALRDDHFGADPERLTWAAVGSLVEANRQLRQVVEFLEEPAA